MIVAILLAAATVSGAWAGELSSGRSSTTDAKGPVFIGDMTPVSVAPGERADIRVPVRVADGHRVQANPASNEFLVPLRLEIGEVEGFGFGDPIYPEGEPYLLEGSDEVLMTYVGEFEVVVPVSANEDASPGEHLVSGELHFQACNSRMCLFPASVQVELQIVVSTSE